MSRLQRNRKEKTGMAPVFEKKNKKKRRSFKEWFKSLKTWKKVLLITLTVLLIAAIAVGVWAYSFFSGMFDDMHEATPEDYDLSLVDVDGYYNILLLGVDSRDMDDLKGTRSDAIMIVSINKDTNDVKILSVYRDTFLKMGDTTTYDKITHACVYGGPEMTIKSLNQALDLNISNYVIVNFKAVADLVDAVGGIEVNVEEYEIEQLNKYTKATARNIGREDYNLVTAPGMQTLEGVQAVSYGRIRKGVGDDFKRTERMRTVMTLVTDKMKGMSFKEIKKIIKMMTPQVQTNLSKTNILALGIRLPQYNIIGTEGFPYNVSTGTINSISYVFPSNLAENVIELHNNFFERMDYTPSAMVMEISNTIIQKREAERSAGTLQNEKEVEVDTSQNVKKPETSSKPQQSTGQGNNTGENKKPQQGGDKENPTKPGNNPGGSENSKPSGGDSGNGTQTPDDSNQGGSQGGNTGGGDSGNGDSGGQSQGGSGNGQAGGGTGGNAQPQPGSGGAPQGGSASSANGGSGTAQKDKAA